MSTISEAVVLRHRNSCVLTGLQDRSASLKLSSCDSWGTGDPHEPKSGKADMDVGFKIVVLLYRLRSTSSKMHEYKCALGMNGKPLRKDKIGWRKNSPEACIDDPQTCPSAMF